MASIILSLIAFLAINLFFHGLRVEPWFGNLLLEQEIKTERLVPLSTETYWLIYNVLKFPNYWLLLIVLTAISILPAFILKTSKLMIWMVSNSSSKKDKKTNSKNAFINQGYQREDIENLRV